MNIPPKLRKPLAIAVAFVIIVLVLVGAGEEELLKSLADLLEQLEVSAE